MAYKNQKKNKKRTKELRKDPEGWRQKRKEERHRYERALRINELVKSGYDRETLEKIMP